MTRRVQGVLLAALVAGIVASVRVLALGRSGAWLRWASAPGAAFAFRVLTIAMGLAAWRLSQALLGSRGLRDGAIGDAGHDWTSPLHARFVKNPGAANAVLIASSAFIDLFGVFLLGSALFGPTLRPGIGLLLLFAFRQVSQVLCALPTPPGMIWRRPGFPSLLVTYDVANDFFFSGHTAIAVLGAIETAQVAPGWMAALAALVAALEGTTVIVLRAHYTMDVLAAIVAAFAAAGLAAIICVGF